MIKIDGITYYLDTNEIINFITKNNKTDNKVKIITKEEIFSDVKSDAIQTTITSTDDWDDSVQTIRYDLIKTMLDTLFNSGVESKDGDVFYTDNVDDLSLGVKIILNTLSQESILVDDKFEK